ncbi:potassium uptake protein, TrkH family [Candidatus Methanoperedens nitroreducens]|uniref:Potassium uptake protein, TrkH family n=1 Tax=Candidatus Methanoperedens nitratireducens TaxID=1392998 RepID=A0A062UXK2_9EURY|nr:TrkH family potassium uptake protein [Candidatus Methanoperedens nitroreducens]KCZ71716.1 potassium uptake protein, TrkH family [Candidatus Methanoperedens nitroreducens]MDJ1422311.1 TrkH family potassium uptake protein [Candidatus Methanoperedens sp.]
MNYRVVFNILGTVIKFLGISLLIPLVVAVYYNEPESILIFAITFILVSVMGAILEYTNRPEFDELTHRESVVIVAMGWFLVALLGAIPFLLAGISPIDSLFESMSGFTTTGSSILPEIEIYSRSILFWRSMTQWLGGMGIIVLVIAILPRLAVAGRQMFRAETTGPMKDKLRPRLKDTAQILWGVYLTFSLLEIIILKFAGMTLYDAIVHTFSTMATGGFSPKNESIAAFGDPFIEAVIIIFMLIAGVNFSMFYRTLRVERKSLIRDEEFQAYIFIIAISTLIITLYLWNWGETLQTAFRYASFQVVSIMTTAGFASANFDLWPDSTKMILLLLMFVGGSAGSTAGAMKVIRVILLIKYGLREIYRLIHPKMVRPIRIGDTSIPDDVMQAILSFFVLYLLAFVGSTLILSAMGLDLITSMSASATTLGNVGPGFNLVGPNFAAIPEIGKIILLINMWIGRLEVLTVLVLFVPSFWKR